MLDDAFWAIHSGLPREGPGDNESTARALARMRDLPVAPKILDIGCGPGMQTLELARRSGGRVTAVDLHPAYLSEVSRRARAEGLADHVATVRASMTRLPFADGAFDALWCEGAAYFMGFEAALTAWRRLLSPGGALAVTEPVYFQARAETPAPVLALFADYADMTTPTETLARATAAGYEVIGHFPLPPSAWLDDYYAPIEARVTRLEADRGDDPAIRRRIEEARAEIDLYRKHGDTYGYLFVILRRPL